jgi:hypothetical protein
VALDRGWARSREYGNATEGTKPLADCWEPMAPRRSRQYRNETEGRSLFVKEKGYVTPNGLVIEGRDRSPRFTWADHPAPLDQASRPACGAARSMVRPLAPAGWEEALDQ